MKSRQVLGSFLVHRTLMPLPPAVFAAGNMRHPQHAATLEPSQPGRVMALPPVDGIGSVTEEQRGMADLTAAIRPALSNELES